MDARDTFPVSLKSINSFRCFQRTNSKTSDDNPHYFETNIPFIPSETNTPFIPIETNTPFIPSETNTPFIPNETNTPFIPIDTNTPFSPSETNTPFIPSKTNTPFIPSETNAPFIPSETNTPFIPNETNTPFIPSKTNTPFIPSKTNTPFIPSKTNTPFIPSKTNAPFIPSETNTPFIPNETNTPFIPSETNTPFIPNETNTPFIPSKTNTPFIPSETNAPFIPSETNTPFIPSETNTPFIPSETNIPFIPSETNTPFIPNETNTPFIPIDTNTPFSPSETNTPFIPSETNAPFIPIETNTPFIPNETNNPSIPNETTTPFILKEINTPLAENETFASEFSSANDISLAPKFLESLINCDGNFFPKDIPFPTGSVNVSLTGYGSDNSKVDDTGCKSKMENPLLCLQSESVDGERQDLLQVSVCGPLTRTNYQIQELLQKLPSLGAIFNICGKIGEGTFSSVYLGTLRNVPGDKKFAIKHLVPTTLPARTERELRCMQDMGGEDNVVAVDLCLREKDCVVFVMPYLPHKRFTSLRWSCGGASLAVDLTANDRELEVRISVECTEDGLSTIVFHSPSTQMGEYVSEMDAEETRHYMKNLFLALRRVHSFNIIHRDVKPSNFLYDRDNRKFLLVDFGLAHPMRTAARTSSAVLKPFRNLEFENKKRKRSDEEQDVCSEGPKRAALQSHVNCDNIPVPSKPNILSRGWESFQEPHTRPQDTLKSTLAVRKVQDAENTPPPKQGRKTPRFKSPMKARLVYGGHSSIKKKLFGGNDVRPPLPKRGGVQAAQRFQALKPTANKMTTGASFVRVQDSKFKCRHLGVTGSNQHKSLFSRPTVPSGQCPCYGQPVVCSLCKQKKPLLAARAGTPGFRPPEVLLKYQQQTTAVDMWAAGVILLCILSGSYPFFRSPDDLTGLAEIITIFGSNKIRDLAQKLGRRIQSSQNRKPLDIRKLCKRLRSLRTEGKEKDGTEYPVCRDCKQLIKKDGCVCLEEGELLKPRLYEPDNSTEFPESAYDLLKRLLDLNPSTRITAADALMHPFIKGL
uniref:non-specific serine/threonine protein kinase n=1 Tax=Timema monikensis TaxID=170555 RepID=A0A7R9HMP4_9NEOP|nr:unnamed protein product [Timema monikensis]